MPPPPAKNGVLVQVGAVVMKAFLLLLFLFLSPSSSILSPVFFFWLKFSTSIYKKKPFTITTITHESQAEDEEGEENRTRDDRSPDVGGEHTPEHTGITI